MDIEYTIRKLNEQKQKVNQGDTEVWLKTTYSIIEEYFSVLSSRTQSFQGLLNDFAIQKISGVTSAHASTYKSKGLEYITEIIQHLEDKQQKDAIEKANFLKHKHEQIKQNLPIESSSHGPKVLPVASLPSPTIITQLPFGISATLFWSIVIAFVSGAFIFGLYFGSTKFDRDKIEYYEQVKKLSVDTILLNKKIAFKDSIISQKDSIISSKVDSLELTNKNLNSLYLLLSDKLSK